MALQVPRSSLDSQDVLDHERTVLERQIATHANAIIELKGRINRMSRTARLPPEILSEIFTLVAVEYYQSRRWNHYSPAYAYKWIAITHVCRTWREIALGTPRLWSRITLTRPDIALEVLARSKKAPLWVSATLGNVDDPRAAALDTLMAESNRLKELQLTGPTRTVLHHAAKWRTSADLLESLTISSDFKQFDPDALLPSAPLSSELFSGQTPNLHRLQVHRITIDWTNPIICPSLRTLTIHAMYDTASRVGKFSQFLDALEGMPLLETLQLRESIPRLPEDVVLLSEGAQRTVSLPNLRSIEVVSDAIDCANFLRHVSAPPNVRVTVNGRTERGAEALVQVFGEWLGRSVPLTTARLAPMYSSQIYIQLWRDYVDPNDKTRDVLPADAELSLDSFPQSRALQALMHHSVFFARLHRFEIDIESQRSWDWRALFGRMPEVRVLSVTGHPEADFLPALAAMDESEGADLPLQHLHTLELESVRFGCAHSDHESRFLEELMNWVEMRSHFRGPIHTLVLRACINAEEADVDRLRELVADVQWDGRKCFEDDYYSLSSLEAVELGDHLFYDPLAPAELDDLYDDDHDLDFFMIPFGF